MKGIFNASLEESMNLVTDDYIENAVNKDNDSQSIGVFIVLLVILSLTAGMFWVTWYNQLMYFAVLVAFVAFLAIILTAFYIVTSFRLKQKRVLINSSDNVFIGSMMLLFIIETEVLFLFLSYTLFRSLLQMIFYHIVIVIVFSIITLRYYEKIWRSLYDNRLHELPLVVSVNRFVVFAKKYGWLLLIVLYVVRHFLKLDNFVEQGSLEIKQYLVGLFGPLFPLLIMPIVFEMTVQYFPGFYLNKYLEDYRQLSGYSVEVWYGTKIKQKR